MLAILAALVVAAPAPAVAPPTPASGLARYYASADTQPSALAAVSSATPLSGAQNPAVIKAVADAVGAVADAVGKVADVVMGMARTVDSTKQERRSREARTSLIQLSRLLVRLRGTQAATVIPELARYIENPQPARWEALRTNMAGVLILADSALRRIEGEETALVLQPAYAALDQTLRGRIAVVSRLRELPPPTTQAELAELRRLLRQYRLLHVQLESAIEELNAYVRATFPGS